MAGRPHEPVWLRERRRRRAHYLAQLEEGEAVLAEGAMRHALDYLMVTSRRIIWREDASFVSLPFDVIQRAEQVVEQTHRYALRLIHEPIDRPRHRPLPWDLPHQWRIFRERHRWNRESVLRFSRQNTVAATAIREELTRRSIPLGPIVVRPHRRKDGTLYRVGPVRAWWMRRGLGL
jgi:hypothetical protein